MESFITSQIKPTLKHLPWNLIRSHFIPKTDSGVENVKSKVGFIRGICHPTDNFEQVKRANLEWVRVDIPFPFDAEGNIQDSYVSFKQRLTKFHENGLKVMAVTPYPYTYIEFGLDPRIAANRPRIEEIARFFLTDLKDLVHGIQITNEMGIPRFTIPLTMGECADFIALNAVAMAPVKGNVIVGYNSAGPQADLHQMLRPYLKYIDYIGVDIYMGCFAIGWMWIFDALISYLRAFTGKPIILCEFGYISDGAPKTKQEKLDILRQYGAESEKDAKRNIEAFIDRMPTRMKEYIRHCCENSEHFSEYVFGGEFKNHLYKELPKLTVIPHYPHTPEGQAKFYHDIIPRLRKYDYLCGMIIYCYSDSECCYVCGQEGCPTETRWGLVTVDGKEKPSYYEVQKAFQE